MKRINRAGKFTAVALTAVMTLSLAACGRQDSGSQGTAEQKEYIYVPV